MSQKGHTHFKNWITSFKNKIFKYVSYINRENSLLYIRKTFLVSTVKTNKKMLARELTSEVENIHVLEIETFVADCEGYLEMIEK